MPSAFRRFAFLVALTVLAAAVFASSAGGGYYTPLAGGCVQDEQAYVSGYNSWGVNVVHVNGFCGGSATYSWPCLYYSRPDGTQYVWTCYYYDGYDAVDFVDPRDISYGRAVCYNDGPRNTYFQ